MTGEEFNRWLDNRIKRIRVSLESKGSEYASADNRFSNFTSAAQLNGTDASLELWHFMTKHIISVRDMVMSGNAYPMRVWMEKLGDIVNYAILLEAMEFSRGNDCNSPKNGSGTIEDECATTSFSSEKWSVPSLQAIQQNAYFTTI